MGAERSSDKHMVADGSTSRVELIDEIVTRGQLAQLTMRVTKADGTSFTVTHGAGEPVVEYGAVS